MTEDRHRFKNIEHSKGWKEFYRCLLEFTGNNNFQAVEMCAIIHMMNSFYFMGYPVENASKD
jgi:hypothetical protein